MASSSSYMQSRVRSRKPYKADVTHLFNSCIFPSRIMHANMMEQCVLPNPSEQRSLNCKHKGNHNDRTNRCLHESAVRKSVANFHSQHFHHPPPVLPPN